MVGTYAHVNELLSSIKYREFVGVVKELLGTQEGFFIEFIELLIGEVVEEGSHDRFGSTVTVAFRGRGKPQFRVDGLLSEVQV